MSQWKKTMIPTASTSLRPHVIEGVEDKIELKMQKAKIYHDRSSHPLPPLKVGQEVKLAPLQKLKKLATRKVEQLSTDPT